MGCTGLKPKFLEGLKNLHLFADALPFRNGAVHFCYDSSTLRPLIGVLQRVLNNHNRLRFRAHYGESTTQFLFSFCFLAIDVNECDLLDDSYEIYCFLHLSMG